MSAFVIFIRQRTKDLLEMERYAPKAEASLAGHPIEVLAAYGAHEVLEGTEIEGAVLVRFPSMEAARTWYNSPAYQEAREYRFRGADYRAFIFESL